MGILNRTKSVACPNCGDSRWTLNEQCAVSYTNGAVVGSKVARATEKTTSAGPTITCDACAHLLPPKTRTWWDVVYAYRRG